MNHQPIKILHIFGRMNRGGAEMRTLDLMRYLDSSQYQFAYCTLSGLPGTLDDEILSLGGEIYPCALDWTFQRRFRQLLREQQFDVIHSHVHYFSGFLLRLAQKENIPIRIAHFRNTYDGHSSNLRRIIQRKLMCYWIDHFATDILAVSEGAMQFSWRDDWQNDDRCKVVYNGVDSEPFSVNHNREEIFTEFGIPIDSKIHVHVGRMDPPKNHERLISIFSEIAQSDSSTYLLLVGRGNDSAKAKIDAQISIYNIQDKVIMAGERDDVPRLLSIADLLIFPSLWEGLPGVVIEACAAGIPVLASDLPGIIEIASFIPSVYTLSLDEPNTIWRETAQQLIRQMTKEKIIQDFEQSPFMIGQCANSLEYVWTKNR